MFDQAFGAWTTSFCITEHKLHSGVGWALLYKEWLQASDFLWLLMSLNCMCVIKNVLLKSLLKERQIFRGKLLQTEEERIDFAKNHSLYVN